MGWPTQLSPHLTSNEFIITQHRQYLDQQDNPPQEIIQNALYFAPTVFEPARAIWGPTILSSGYRCPDLNAAIGGAQNSFHMKGLAADCIPVMVGASKYMTLKAAYLAIMNDPNVPYDQLIWEYGRWIHLGGTFEGAIPRSQCLMIFALGQYEPFNPNDPRVV